MHLAFIIFYAFTVCLLLSEVKLIAIMVYVTVKL